MKLVLKQDVPNLGKSGEVKDVANGYARNFLLPKGMAVEATAGELQRLQQQSDREAKLAARAQKEHATLATRLEGASVTLRAKVGSENRLYGSITAKDVADALQGQLKLTVDRRSVELEEPIRTLGSHQVPVHVAGDLHPKITVVVVETR